MSEMDVRSEYTRILEQRLLELEASTSRLAAQKRTHPRLKVEASDVWISTVPEFALMDMSVSGMAINSNHPLTTGELIHISVGTVFSVDAEVVACTMVEPPSEYSDALFRIQCRFVEELQGMELLVRAIKTNA